MSSVSSDQALDKLSEKLNSQLLVQEEHGFLRGPAYRPQELQIKPGLDRVKARLYPSEPIFAKKSKPATGQIDRWPVQLTL